MAPTRQQLGKARRWVVKIGSALITDEGRGLDLPALEDWAEQVARLTQAGHEVVLVSSGAVAEGMSRLGWIERPHALHELQAAAAVGQMGLVQAYESRFQRHGLHAAQVLLTHEDLADRRRYLNARSTLRTLLRLGAIPVVNENDTVATEEIRFGDNDTLAALVCNLVEASLLVILTDQQGLYDRDPRTRPDAQLVSEGLASDPELLKLVAPTFGRLGRGGMATKLTAASRAARSGTHTLITSGRNPAVLERIAAGEALGTLLRPDREPMAARKQWIAGQLVSKGELILDAGAARVIREAGRSLLPVGVTHVKGRFSRGDVVTCLDPDGRAVARGLVNYAADEARRIMRRKAEEIESILGYVDEPELIHRDNLVLV
ncbi:MULTISPECIES: glutamate 5-kinase [Ectothiorhodospira]|uniref:glutamate 5-kinase n=1 Tax=Ectothiorhodospira TaxID=1051 RepID=UPI00024A8814|nr:MULTISPECIES: glutamate 5-kinase [Ectothiorhodospira]EHQ51841.1 glutamate 5-kinase [Ectothiorhodospira sp. PHS-1]MCG5512317.1 glutamate 5-kinase [Ectothiorhodospira shaposhnikovii]